MFFYILVLASLVVFFLWLHRFYSIWHLCHSKNIGLRGILKHYNLDIFDSSQKKSVQIWTALTISGSLLLFFWIIYYTWASDYSFLMGIFPIVWFYWLGRALLWEKKDLIDA